MQKLLQWVLFMMTLAFLDKPIEILFKYFLHKNREEYVEESIARGLDEEDRANPTHQLRLDIEREDRRVFNMIDQSILSSNIVQARHKFFLSALLTNIALFLLYNYFEFSLSAFIMPNVTMAVAWITAVITCHVPYNKRVDGAMDSILGEYGYQQRKRLSSTQIIHTLGITRQPSIALLNSPQTAPQISIGLPGQPSVSNAEVSIDIPDQTQDDSHHPLMSSMQNG